MQIVIPTCNQYGHLIPGCVGAIRKYWPSRTNDFCLYDWNITVLHYDGANKDAWPSGVEYVSMGEQPAGKVWTDGILKVVDSLDCNFLLMLDDYYVSRAVNPLEMFALKTLVEKDYADKIELTSQSLKLPPYKDYSMLGLVERGQTSRYRNSLQAAIWQLDYFAKFLVPGWTPWQFEIEGMKMAYNDGAVILGPKYDVLSYDNVMQGPRA